MMKITQSRCWHPELHLRPKYSLPRSKFLLHRHYAEKAAKPLPYNAKPTPKPLVEARPAAPKPQPATDAASTSAPKSLNQRKGVAFPRTRFAIGVVFVGAIVYSMVFARYLHHLSNTTPKLTNPYASTPTPSASTPPQSPSATPSLNAKAA